MASKRRKRRLRERRAKKADTEPSLDFALPLRSDQKLKVTYPNGRTEIVPDDGRSFPKGTMIVWSETKKRGRGEMRWCVTGGGWPFDD
jgi:hypothetical protein